MHFFFAYLFNENDHRLTESTKLIARLIKMQTHNKQALGESTEYTQTHFAHDMKWIETFWYAWEYRRENNVMKNNTQNEKGKQQSMETNETNEIHSTLLRNVSSLS